MEKAKIDLFRIGNGFLIVYFLIIIVNGVIGLITLYPPNYWSDDFDFKMYTWNYTVNFFSILLLVIGLILITVQTVKITKTMNGYWEKRGTNIWWLSSGIIITLIGAFVSMNILSINLEWLDYYLIFPVSIVIANILMGFLLFTLEDIQNGLKVMKGSKEESRIVSLTTTIFALIWMAIFIISTPIITKTTGNVYARVEMLETINFIHLIIYGGMCFIAIITIQHKWQAFLKMGDLILRKTITEVH